MLRNFAFSRGAEVDFLMLVTFEHEAAETSNEMIFGPEGNGCIKQIFMEWNDNNLLEIVKCTLTF